MRNESLSRVIESYFPENRRLNILEVACGTGLTLQSLSTRWAGKHAFTGMDASETMLEQAKEKFVQLDSPPLLLQGAVPGLSFEDKTFDFVYATRFIYMFSHEEKKAVVRDFVRVLRDDGVLAIEFYAPNMLRSLRHWLHSNESRNLARYLSFTTVKRILGAEVQLHPLRIAGANIIVSTIGNTCVRRLTRFASFTRWLGLFEYLAVARKSDIPG